MTGTQRECDEFTDLVARLTTVRHVRDHQATNGLGMSRYITATLVPGMVEEIEHAMARCFCAPPADPPT
ncbi:hypothetical protein AB0B89_36620 [Sphaerisporangium sp. NPDC049002]|uniref:hypothetical protein n=1 Tax=Sphaerisporangium sp. NPDC049002 TaxID=3155392 RepID=UPI0033F13594